jgi:hypothetical protein
MANSMTLASLYRAPSIRATDDGSSNQKPNRGRSFARFWQSFARAAMERGIAVKDRSLRFTNNQDQAN